MKAAAAAAVRTSLQAGYGVSVGSRRLAGCLHLLMPLMPLMPLLLLMLLLEVPIAALQVTHQQQQQQQQQVLALLAMRRLNCSAGLLLVLLKWQVRQTWNSSKSSS
jgi:hypothetical protein